MFSMSKEEMCQYLFDYALLCDKLIHNPNTPSGILFSYYMIDKHRYDDNNIEYYYRMIRTYMSYIFLRKFSYLEDFLLNRDDFLNNNDLKGLRNGIISIDASPDITDKRIVQLIRNGFNHNNDPDFERFNISKNAGRYEIKFKDLRTQKEKDNNAPIKPFRIKISDKYLADLYGLISSKSQNVVIVSYDIPDGFDYNSPTLRQDLSKIKIIRYYFTKKLTREQIDKMRDFHIKEYYGKEEVEKIHRDFHDYLSSITEPVIFDLDNEQVNTLYSMINNARKNNEFYLKNGEYSALYRLIHKVVPLPLLKSYDIEEQVILSSFLTMDEKLNHSSILELVRNITNGDNPEVNDEFVSQILNTLNESHDTGDLLDLFYDLLDGRFVQLLPLITFIDSVVTHLCYDKFINVNGLKYNTEKIRNSFVHGRWFINQDNKIVLYDADPRNINDFKLELIGKIDITDFAIWARDYLNQSKLDRLDDRIHGR